MPRTPNRLRAPAQMFDWALALADFLAIATAAAVWTYGIGRVLGIGI
jgi:hypothetical protein